MKSTASQSLDSSNDIKAVLLARLQKLKSSRNTEGETCPSKTSAHVQSNAVAIKSTVPAKRASTHIRPTFSASTRKPLHNFETDKDDHCETSDIAYDDIVPVLKQLACLLGKAPKDLRIYDPYYCNGAVIKNLAARGFAKVYNRNEDFYQIIRDNKVPDFDACVTNPPYSGDHVEKMLKFCKASGKPFFCLVPNYVYTKEFYSLVLGDCTPFYVIPEKRYEFWTPGGFRKPSSREKKTSPFVSFWYCHGAEHTSALIKWWRKVEKHELQQLRGASLIQNLKLLPQRAMATFDTNRRRFRKKQRVAIKKRIARAKKS